MVAPGRRRRRPAARSAGAATAVPLREVERATLLHGLPRSAAHLASELRDLSSALADLLRSPDDVLLSSRLLHARPRV